MPHALLDCDVINEQPEQYLRSVGAVFAEFGALTQDSGNVSYGVQIATERYFVMGRTALVFLSDGTLNPNAFRGTPALFKVIARACEPERSRRYDSMAAFYRAWRATRAAYEIDPMIALKNEG